MTLRDIELACRDGRPPHFSHHALECQPPSRRRVFYPFGFPVEVRCETHQIFELYEEMWGMFEQRFRGTPLLCEVYVDAIGNGPYPPSASYRIQGSLLISTADRDNYSHVDLASGLTRVTISHTTLRHPQYASYFFLSAPLAALASRCATPIHAACVSFAQRGFLLCGDSGAGKSTLAYACARSGWQYTSDDSSFLLPDVEPCTVTGNCYQVRFRPESASLFPEINRLTVTPRAAGKPSVEMATLGNKDLRLAPTAHLDCIVFLNRICSGKPSLEPYSREAARAYMEQSLIGTPAQRRRHMASIGRLLHLPVLELRYTELREAIHQLERLSKEEVDELACASN